MAPRGATRGRGGGEGKWVPLVGWGAWSLGLAGENSDKGPLREVSSGDNGLSVGGLGYCFPSPLPREVSMAPSPDLATSVNGDIVWESLSPASLRGVEVREGKQSCEWPLALCRGTVSPSPPPPWESGGMLEGFPGMALCGVSI